MAPVPFGSEGSGVVVAAAGQFSVGDEVCFLVDKMQTERSTPCEGSLSEYVCVHPLHMAKVWKGANLDEAAGTPLALLTAYQLLREGGFAEPGCGAGKSILVHGGSGGVGHFALQLCRNVYRFDRVATTCSEPNAEFVRRCGATEVVPYHSVDFVERYYSSKFDAVFDPVGGDPVCSSSVSPCCVCCSWFGGNAHTNCFVPEAVRALASYTNRSRAVVEPGGVLMGVFTGVTLSATSSNEKSCCCQAPPCVICCSLLPRLCCYNCPCGGSSRPRYVGPYFIPLQKNLSRAAADLETMRSWLENDLVTTHLMADSNPKQPESRSLVPAHTMERLDEAVGAMLPMYGATQSTGMVERPPFRGKVVVRVRDACTTGLDNAQPGP